MTRIGDSKPDPPPAEATERGRVARVYAQYQRSARKRRAWALDNPGNAAIREELLTRIRRAAEPELRGPGEILDLGCGTGWCLRALAYAGVQPDRLHGVDLLPTRVAAAQSAVPAARVAVGDARRLAFDDGRFALVLMLTLLSSLNSAAAVREALREARRVLAPGALLLCYEPRFANPLNPQTRLVRDRDLAAAGVVPSDETALTLLPWLARRLGLKTPARYARLAGLGPLRTHRLIAYRAPQRMAGEVCAELDHRDD